MTTFVYDGTEVVKTGREAIRNLSTSPGQSRELTLVEIAPVDKSFDWKKWVDPKQLYVVTDEGK